MLISIQSFGDIITNSSSEVYCMYNWDGMEQIEKAIKEIAKVLNPNIKIEDHLEISLVPKEWVDFYDDNGNEVNYQDLYNQEFGEFCEKYDNDELLKRFPEWYKNFIKKYTDGYNGTPNFELDITGKTELGKVLAKNILNLLYAFEYEEIYDG